jgi:NAD(P)-dependent dehydrogenase (short-subunit alcohol dehydrogenase family)
VGFPWRERVIDLSLDGRVAVVTGAAQGIGRALAMGLADAGARVACLDIDYEGVVETTASIQRAHGDGRSYSARCDVTDLDQVELSRSRVEEALGEVDIVVANAGGPKGQACSFIELDLDSWSQMIDRNLTSSFLTGLVYGRSMATRRLGSMVFVASQLSSVVRPGLTHYAVAKAGVAQLVRGMAVELAPLGVRVNGIAPGPTETPGTAELFGRPEVRDGLIATIPLGRLGVPEEMVGATVFLASDQASFVTGHILYVDGGYTLT